MEATTRWGGVGGGDVYLCYEALLALELRTGTVKEVGGALGIQKDSEKKWDGR